MRYTDWMRRRRGDETTAAAAAQRESQARKLLGNLMNQLKLSGNKQGVMRQTLDDGSVITARFDGTTPTVDVQAPESSKASEFADTNLWSPRGFVVYPAWSDARFGVGLPIVQDPDAGPYDKSNTAPGLARARWTPGGPCGEVLVSADTDAGYPPTQAIPAPMLSDATRGPQFVWSGKGNLDARALGKSWNSYRLELAPFVAHYSDESVGMQQALFEGLNSARKAAGQTEATLRFRGYARVAEITASIMQAAGIDDATSSAYPTTYRTSADRITKEGYSAGWAYANTTDFTRDNAFGMFEFRDIGHDASDAVNLWKDAAGSHLLDSFDSTKPSPVVDVGFRGGFSAAALQLRDRWIQAGNANWQSLDPTLPPISWHSFASVNLAWETYPAQFDTTNVTSPLIKERDFVDANGNCTLVYPRATSFGAGLFEPALGRTICCRGRAIALAPRGGLVWGACVAANGHSDRLIALVHHEEDQPSDQIAEGFTRYLRVWWVDVPKRKGLRMDPQQVICGEAAGDDWAWKGGQMLDMGMMPDPAKGWKSTIGGVNSLKYASCWRFSPDGLHAVCLRDYGALGNYSLLNNAQLGSWSSGLNARTVELHFGVEKDDLVTTVDVHGFTGKPSDFFYSTTSAYQVVLPDDHDLAVFFSELPQSQTAPLTDEKYTLELFQMPPVPIAVDYTARGALTYIYTACVLALKLYAYADAGVPNAGVPDIRAINYIYIGRGNASVNKLDDLDDLLLQGANYKTPSQNAYPEMPVVLDVNSATYAMKITRPHFAMKTQIIDGDSYLLNAEFLPEVPCQTFTQAGVAGVRLCSGGRVVSEDWYPSPDGIVYTFNDLCQTYNGQNNFIRLPGAVSDSVQGFYAQRFGQHVFGYQVSPIPNATYVLTQGPSSDACGCRFTLSDMAGVSATAISHVAPRGGKTAANIPLPDHDWLIYAKVV